MNYIIDHSRKGKRATADGTMPTDGKSRVVAAAETLVSDVFCKSRRISKQIYFCIETKKDMCMKL